MRWSSLLIATLLLFMTACAKKAESPGGVGAPPSNIDITPTPQVSAAAKTFATPAGQGGCVAVQTVPPFQPPLPDSDCVTAVAVTADASIQVVGTQSGQIGQIRDGVLTTVHPPSATGAVTDVQIVTDTTGPGEKHTVVTFVVDQGLGAYVLDNSSFVPFAPDPQADRQAVQAMLEAGYIDPPGPGRIAAGIGDGVYVKNSTSGDLQTLGVAVVSGGEACVSYLPAPFQAGGLPPGFAWCTAYGTIYPAPFITPPVPPPAGDCGGNLANVDANHQIVLTVSDSGFQPSSITINSGETYELTIQGGEPNVLHGWQLVDAASPDGSAICSATVAGTGQATIGLTIGKSGQYTFRDVVHTSITGQLIVR
jgi:plastocyanin